MAALKHSCKGGFSLLVCYIGGWNDNRMVRRKINKAFDNVNRKNSTKDLQRERVIKYRERNEISTTSTEDIFFLE